MTGHKPISALVGQCLLLLVVFKLIRPQATCNECIAFISNKSNNARVFLEKDVSKAQRKLDYTMQVTSTIPYQVFTEHNLNFCHLYWTWLWPLGIHGTPRRLWLMGMSLGCISIQPTINQVCGGLKKCWSEVNDLETMKSYSSSAQTKNAYIACTVLEVWWKWLCSLLFLLLLLEICSCGRSADGFSRLISVMKKLYMTTSAMILKLVETRSPFARSFSWWSCTWQARQIAK